MLFMAEENHWYRAATLAERLKGGNPVVAAALPLEDETTRFRWNSWKSQPPFDEETYFAQRLALDALTEEQFRSFIAEPAETLRERFRQTPAWLAELRQTFSQTNGTASHHWLPERWRHKPTSAFLHAAEPFIQVALTRFAAGVTALAEQTSPLPFDPATIHTLCLELLPKALLEIMNRTMALELNVARLSGALTGATSAERFQSFVEQLRQPARLQALLAEYPVLARLLNEHTQRWAEVSLEFLSRLCCDWNDIKVTMFAGEDPGNLVSLKGGLADTRRGGRTVFIAKFSSGQRLVYKPKSLAVDQHFQELLQWLNDRGAAPAYPTLQVLDRDTHGWVEHINAKACSTKAEVRRFYQRQGGYLALLYLINATDFHAANLIACGETPYLIDLEALFQPRRTEPPNAEAPAHEKAVDAVVHSVLDIGLLPKRSGGNSEFEGIDRSGLGAWDGQVTPYVVARWENEGFDEMHLVRRRVQVLTQRNRPRLPGVHLDVRDFETELQEGFAATYELIRAHREELCADDGPLARFASDEVCVFLRSMRTYRRLLSESYHPDVLRDALDRDRLFDMLWVEVLEDADLARVIQSEQAELQRGDMPLFLTQPQSADLLLDGGQCIENFFAEPSLTTVRRRLAQLNDEDRVRQSWFIKASLATLPVNETPAPVLWHALELAATKAQLLEAAQAVGDRLEQLCIRGTDDAAWLGLMQVQEQDWTVDALGFDLDTGLSGIAMFLAYLGAMTEQRRYTELAQAALKTMQSQIAEWGDEISMIGAFDGWGSVIYALTHLGVLWQRPDLLGEAEAIVERLPELIEEDDELTVYGGAAGCIAALRCLARVRPSARVTEVAIQCGEHLLKRADEISDSGWLNGSAGLFHAWRSLYELTGLERFRVVPQSVNNAIKTEPKTPKTVDDLLARHCLDDSMCQELVAIESAMVWSCEQVRNHSLSEGMAGWSELLLLAQSPIIVTQTMLDRYATAWLDSIQERGWVCGTPLAVETPGLLNGLAGIGWQLLRLAEPDRVPSILFFDAPK